ncbi:MAG TPA: Rpp14/Pop5 family protein [Candidatus Nanoarchaeia archaeon]|nr:Rpp14/Pop5 family protein [Candidatus Nanoarchaeia archaeon]
MPKLKPLLPSLREKKRYIAFEVISEGKIGSADSVEHAIFGSLLKLVGEKGAATAGIIMLKDRYNPETQRGILRTSTKGLKDSKQALTLIDSIEKKEVIVKTLGVSGILKKAVSNYIAA